MMRKYTFIQNLFSYYLFKINSKELYQFTDLYVYRSLANQMTYKIKLSELAII